MRGADFGWDYPPGVTGNEPQIAGWDEDDEEVLHPWEEDYEEPEPDAWLDDPEA